MAIEFTCAGKEISNCTDWGTLLLARIFEGNIPWLLKSPSMAQQPDESTQFFGVMLQQFNLWLLIVCSIIASYTAIAGVIKTTNDGQALGKTWSSFWTPIRVVGVATLMLPLKSGYSALQVAVLGIALAGNHAANSLYHDFLAPRLSVPEIQEIGIANVSPISWAPYNESIKQAACMIVEDYYGASKGFVIPNGVPLSNQLIEVSSHKPLSESSYVKRSGSNYTWQPTWVTKVEVKGAEDEATWWTKTKNIADWGWTTVLANWKLKGHGVTLFEGLENYQKKPEWVIHSGCGMLRFTPPPVLSSDEVKGSVIDQIKEKREAMIAKSFELMKAQYNDAYGKAKQVLALAISDYTSDTSKPDACGFRKKFAGNKMTPENYAQGGLKYEFGIREIFSTEGAGIDELVNNTLQTTRDYIMNSGWISTPGWYQEFNTARRLLDSSMTIGNIDATSIENISAAGSRSNADCANELMSLFYSAMSSLEATASPELSAAVIRELKNKNEKINVTNVLNNLPFKNSGALPQVSSGTTYVSTSGITSQEDVSALANTMSSRITISAPYLVRNAIMALRTPSERAFEQNINVTQQDRTYVTASQKFIEESGKIFGQSLNTTNQQGIAGKSLSWMLDSMTKQCQTNATGFGHSLYRTQCIADVVIALGNAEVMMSSGALAATLQTVVKANKLKTFNGALAVSLSQRKDIIAALEDAATTLTLPEAGAVQAAQILLAGINGMAGQSAIGKQLFNALNSIQKPAIILTSGLPVLPYFVFMFGVIGWLLGVVQTVIAAPLWAALHMTPGQSFIGGERQGYLLMLALFVRPALLIMSLFLGFWLCDVFMDYYVAAFVKSLDAMSFDQSSLSILNTPFQALYFAIGHTSTVGTLFMFFCIGAFSIFFITLTLSQRLPNEVLRWLNVHQQDLGASQGADILANRLQRSAGLDPYAQTDANAAQQAQMQKQASPSPGKP